MKSPKRILHFIPGFLFGGIESRFFDWYERIDKEKVQFDLLIQTDKDNPIFDEFKSQGGRVFQVEKISIKRIGNYIETLKRFFQENEYDAVHCHSPDKSFFVLLMAKQSGVKNRILHARTSSLNGGKDIYIKSLFKKLSPYLATDYFACSQLAGEWLFKNREFKIIQNAVDSERFLFNKNKREITRKELEMGNEIVFGHVGRFTFAKNHEFLIEIFKGINERKKDSKLLLVGDGPEKKRIQSLVKKYSLEESVIFSGYQENVEDFLHAMDIFIFPSRFEGLPGTVLEAQTTGLRCFVSENVTTEVKATDLVSFISIDENHSYWVDKILSEIEKLDERISPLNEIVDSGFDLNSVVKYLEEFYINLNTNRQ